MEEEKGGVSEHCWHPTGVGETRGKSGHDGLKCCWCGLMGSQSWKQVDTWADGHGPHYSVSERVDDGGVKHDGPKECAPIVIEGG